MNGQAAENYIIWIGSADRIASFRMVEGYEKKAFSFREYFMTFLHELQKSGYRFQ